MMPGRGRGMRGQGYAEFALALPVILLLSLALAMALFWGLRGARADAQVFFGTRALQAGAAQGPVEVRPEAGPSPRLVVGRLWLRAEGPRVLGLELSELQAGQVAGRIWRFFGGRPD